MNSRDRKSPLKKNRNRKKTGSFNVVRLLSFALLLVVLAISVVAVGYVIFFRTVVAQEILPALRSAIVFEEPNPPVFDEEETVVKATTEPTAEPTAESDDEPAGQQVEQSAAEPAEEMVVDRRPDLPKVAIIIDDMGYNEALGNDLLKLPFALTYSFLPFAPYTRKQELAAHLAGKTVFLHLPLQPKGQEWNPGPGALFVQDPPELQKEKFAKCLAEVPHAVGVNNHMGSLFTEDKRAMSLLIKEINLKSLVFIDSVTSARSIGFKTAQQAVVKSAKRNVFLDNTLDEKTICKQLELLVSIAERGGSAIGIAHPHPETVNALTTCGAKNRERVDYVSAVEVAL
jgi:polysaccharide deacetylase 2 family uncharacterized protein YibQ